MKEIITIHDTYKRPKDAVFVPPDKNPLTISNVRGRTPPVDKKPPPMKTLTLADLNNTRRQQRKIQRPRPTLKTPRVPSKEEPVLNLTPNPLWTVVRRDAWKGRRVFIVGGGPSLKAFDWKCLRGELTIGINRAFEKFTPTMMFCMGRARRKLPAK